MNTPDKSAIPLAWSEAGWEVDVRRIRRRYPAADVNRGTRNDGQRAVRDAWLIWRTSQTRAQRRHEGFTLIELLVVIAIIAILAGILIPAVIKMKGKTKIKLAQTEMKNLESGLSMYESEYGRPPVALSKTAIAALGKNDDVTYGGTFDDGRAGSPPVSLKVGSPNDLTNSALLALLLPKNLLANQGLQDMSALLNPRQGHYYQAKFVDRDYPGVSLVDGIFRDPWQMPYVITVDVNDDNKCFDSFYSIKTGVGAIPAPVAIWSAGPDRLITSTDQTGKGDANRDNIVSWK